MALSNAERQRRYRERKKLGRANGQGTAEKRADTTETRAAAPAPRPKPYNPKPPLSDEDISKWLGYIAQGRSTRAAAREIGHDHKRLDDWRKRSDENQARYTEAQDASKAAIEDELARRGIFGYDEVTKNGKGEVIRVTTRYDSALAQLVAKAKMPEKYRENHSGPAQPTVIVFTSPFADLMPPVQGAIEGQALELPEETD